MSIGCKCQWPCTYKHQMFEFVHYRFVTAKKEEKMNKTDDKKGMIVPCAFAHSKTS